MHPKWREIVKAGGCSSRLLPSGKEPDKKEWSVDTREGNSRSCTLQILSDTSLFLGILGWKKKKKRHLVWLCINYCNKDVNLSDHCTMQFAVLCPVPARDSLLPAGAACSSWTKLATCQYLPRQASSSLHSVSVCRSKILPWGQTAEMLRLGYLRVALMQIGHHWGDLQNRHKPVLHCFIYH